MKVIGFSQLLYQYLMIVMKTRHLRAGLDEPTTVQSRHQIKAATSM